MTSNQVIQDYAVYSDEDHNTWGKLCKKQSLLGIDEISEQFLDGLQKLQLDAARVIKIDAISRVLQSINGWSLVPVTGLIPTRDFFYLVVNKRYPVTVSIRQPHEIEFSEQPDIFHDVYGHLPLLANKQFTNFLTTYSNIALKFVKDQRAIDYLGRLYWFTYEMGLINENGICKAYGAAIITSSKERRNIKREDVPKHPFSLNKIFHTPYNPYKLQNEYFVINSFDELFNVTRDLDDKLNEHLLVTNVNVE